MGFKLGRSLNQVKYFLMVLIKEKNSPKALSEEGLQYFLTEPNLK